MSENRVVSITKGLGNMYTIRVATPKEEFYFGCRIDLSTDEVPELASDLEDQDLLNVNWNNIIRSESDPSISYSFHLNPYPTEPGDLLALPGDFHVYRNDERIDTQIFGVLLTRVTDGAGVDLEPTEFTDIFESVIRHIMGW